MKKNDLPWRRRVAAKRLAVEQDNAKRQRKEENGGRIKMIAVGVCLCLIGGINPVSLLGILFIAVSL